MKFLCFILLVTLLISCEKSKSDVTSFEGLWIENNLRSDTIEFTGMFSSPGDNKFSFFLKSKPYMDPSQNPTYPVNHSSIYSYYLEGSSIYLRTFLSSSTIYNQYDINVAGNSKHFTVKRFYSRNSLPSVITFEKIR